MQHIEELEAYIACSQEAKQAIADSLKLKKSIIELSVNVLRTLKEGGKIIFCGNGGSFADSQHLAAEFVSKFMRDRAPLPAMALGTNSSTLSAIGNDYGYEPSLHVNFWWWRTLKTYLYRFRHLVIRPM